ncbi:MAG: class I SAM-dependent methyltransferase [Xanthobacteraceae bacterium]|jgi:SAM-dependent methyltransferase
MHILCPACAEPTEHRHLFAKNGCDILQCGACGLGRAVASEFNPEQYYTSDYFSGGHPDGYADYRGAEPILRREFARTVKFIRKYRPAGRLLDIGCAYGFFLEEARPFYEVAGIEIAEHAAEFCRSRGLRVLTGVADETTMAQLGTMDVIVLLDVIEHVPDPQETLTLCRRYLNTDGIVAITTGDFASLYARLAGPHWRLMTPPQHLWYHTPESMRRLGRSLGLTLEAYDHPWKLVPLSLIAFQLRRMLAGNRPVAGRGSQIGIPVNTFDAMRCVFRKLAP